MAAKSVSQKSFDLREALSKEGVDKDVIDRIMTGLLSQDDLLAASKERGEVVSSALDQSIEAREDVGFDTGNVELLNEAQKVAMEYMTGEIDPQTKATVEQFSAEIAKSGGLGLSQAATNLTAKNLGLTRLALKQYGADLGSKLGELEQRSMQFNQETRLKWAELELKNNQWRDSFSLNVQGLEIGSREFKLQAYDLISRNQNAVYGMINDLIKHNSRNRIEGLQQNIDTLSEDIIGQNRRIAQDFDLFYKENIEGSGE